MYRGCEETLLLVVAKKSVEVVEFDNVTVKSQENVENVQFKRIDGRLTLSPWKVGRLQQQQLPSDNQSLRQ